MIGARALARIGLAARSGVLEAGRTFLQYRRNGYGPRASSGCQSWVQPARSRDDYETRRFSGSNECSSAARSSRCCRRPRSWRYSFSRRGTPTQSRSLVSSRSVSGASRSPCFGRKPSMSARGPAAVSWRHSPTGRLLQRPLSACDRRDRGGSDGGRVAVARPARRRRPTLSGSRRSPASTAPSTVNRSSTPRPPSYERRPVDVRCAARLGRGARRS